MRISLKRTGGITGIAKSKILDDDSLSSSDKKELEQLLIESDFFSLPFELPKDPNYRDAFCYELCIEYEDKTHTVKLSESSMTIALRRLIQWIINH